jgi:hypothetical protein
MGRLASARSMVMATGSLAGKVSMRASSSNSSTCSRSLVTLGEEMGFLSVVAPGEEIGLLSMALFTFLASLELHGFLSEISSPKRLFWICLLLPVPGDGHGSNEFIVLSRRCHSEGPFTHGVDVKETATASS